MCNSDCCMDTCVDGTYSCDSSNFDCRDPDSETLNFCNSTARGFTTSARADDAAAIGTVLGEDEIAFVCDHCDVEMRDYFFSIGVSHAWQ